MTDISQAAKERASALLRAADPREEPRELAAWAQNEFAKYIDKVSAVAEGVLNSETMDKTRLQELVVKDIDPLADALRKFPLGSMDRMDFHATCLRNALAEAGYKIVKDQG